jgi:hypothetical protein
MQFEGASLRQTVRWKVFGPGGAELARGEQVAVEDTGTAMLTDAVRDATAKAFARIARTKTLTPDALALIRALGYQIEITHRTTHLEENLA